MLRTSQAVHCQPTDAPYQAKGLPRPRLPGGKGPSLPQSPASADQQAAQSLCTRLSAKPVVPPRHVSRRGLCQSVGDGSPDGGITPELPESCQPLRNGASPGHHLNDIRLRITEFDAGKAKYDSFWVVATAIEVAAVTTLGSVTALCGTLAWLGNGLDASLAYSDRKAARRQYIEALAHRRHAVLAWMDLARHLADNPGHQAAQDLLDATAEAVKLLDTVLNSYENFYKPPTESALRQERRAREYRLNQKHVEACLNAPTDLAAHQRDMKALKARVKALPLDPAERRKRLKALKTKREALAVAIQGFTGPDPQDLQHLSQQLAGTEQDIQRLREHFKATGRLALLRHPKHLGQKQGKHQRDVLLVGLRTPLEMGSAVALFASIAPELGSIALELGLGGTGLGVLSAPLLARAAALDKREAALEAKLGEQNILLARERLETAQRLLSQFDAAPQDDPHIGLGRCLVRNQSHSMVMHETKNKLLPNLSTWRFWKSRMLKRGVVPALFFGAGLFCISTALSVASSGAVAIAAAVLAATVLTGFLVKVITMAAYRQTMITNKIIGRQQVAEHALKILGPHLHRLYTASDQELELLVHMVKTSAPPELREHISVHKLRYDNAFLATECMAREVHAFAKRRHAGEDIHESDCWAARMAEAMGAAPANIKYLVRGLDRFASDEEHLDECRKLIGGGVFQLPLVETDELPRQSNPLELTEIEQGLGHCLTVALDPQTHARNDHGRGAYAYQRFICRVFEAPSLDNLDGYADRSIPPHHMASLHDAKVFALWDMRRDLLQTHGIDEEALRRFRAWLDTQPDADGATPDALNLNGHTLPRERLVWLLDALLDGESPEPLPVNDPLPKALPKDLSHELVARAIKETGKQMEWKKLRALRDRGLRAFPHPLGTAKQLIDKDDASNGNEFIERVVVNLKKLLPCDKQGTTLIPEPYATEDQWLAQELPLTAQRCADLGETLSLTPGIGQEKQRQGARQRLHWLEEATYRCAEHLGGARMPSYSARGHMLAV